MKKFSKVLLLTMLTVILVFNTCGVVLADTNATIVVTEETVNAETGVKKLVFTATTPAGTGKVTDAEISFSYKNDVIQPVSADEGNKEVTVSTTANDFLDVFGYDADLETVAAQWIVRSERTAVKITGFKNAGASANSGLVFGEFFFKVKENKSMDSESFVLETEYAEGSFLKALYPTADNAAAVTLGTKDLKYFNYATPADDTENIAAPTFTYTGSDIKVFKEVTFEIEGNSTTIAAPTKYPTEAAKRIKITATAWATDGSEMEGYLDNFSWGTSTSGDDIALNDYAIIDSVENNQALPKNQAILMIKPGCPAGTVTVKGTNGSCEKEQLFTITRDVLKEGAAAIKAKAGETEIAPEGTITVVKPATTGSKSVVFTGKVLNGYGEEIELAAVAFSASAADLDTGITFADNTLTVTNEAPDCNINVTASYGELTEVISVDIVGLVVDWSPVTVKNITYGDTNASAVTLPADSKGTASVDGKTVTGEFSVLNPEDKQNAGETEIVVAFTADDTVENGEYAGMVINNDYEITIAKAETVITVRDILDAVYTGEEVNVVATTNRGTDDSDIQYDVRPVESSIPTSAINAGEYTVRIYVPETTNYLKNEAMATIKIAKANVDMTGVVFADKTVAYTGEEVEVAVVNLPEKLDVVVAYEGLEEGTKPVNASETAYKAIATFAVKAEYENNYNVPEAKIAFVTINKAVATKFVVDDDDDTVLNLDATITALDASTNGVTSTEDLAGYKLPGYVYVAFEGGVEAVEGITWATEDVWNAKGGKYNYTATIPANNNISFKNVSLEAEIEVTKVVGTITSEAAIANKTIAKGRIEELDDFATFADIDLPYRITVSYPTETDPMYVDLEAKWNKTVADLKAAAATVTDAKDATVDLAIDASTYTPVDGADFSWITIETGDKMTLTITNKTPATVTVEPTGKEYDGEEIAEPETVWTPSDEGTDMDAEVVVTYVGVGDTVYEASTDKPVNAGTYEAVAKLNSNIYSGVSEAVPFTITAKPITYEVAAKEKKYSDPNPTFTGALAIDSVLAERDSALVTDENTVEKVLGIEFECLEGATAEVGDDVDITAEASNPNYAVTVTPAKLTIVAKPLGETTFVPVISGATANGSTLTFAVEGLAADQYDATWSNDSTEATYTLSWIDSNKVVTVTIAGKDNYTGSVTSAEFVVPKYEISGVLGFDVENGVESDAEKLDVGDTVILDLENIVGAHIFDDLGATDIYTWYKDGVAIEGATSASYTLIEGDMGVLSASVSVEGDFAGKVEAIIGEIGKAPLKGTITITEAENVLTAVVTADSATADDYEVKWFRGETEITSALVEGAYTLTSADYGKTITVKAIAKEGTAYTGEIVSAYDVPAIAPSDVAISTSRTATSITATLTAKANGATISSFSLTITDGAEFTQTVTVTADESGKFVHTFADLTTGTQYTLTATATNSAGTSEAATATATPAAASRPSPKPTPVTPVEPTPDTGDGEGIGSEGEGTTTPEADVTVKVEDTTASIDKEIIADKEAVEVATETESGTSVTTTVNVAGANVESLEVSTKDSEKAAAGAAAEGAVGTPVEVKVDAKDAEGNKANVTVNVAIPSEEKAYAYIIDENGVATRTESVYNEETGEVEVANVPDGAVVMLSTTAPATFDDAAEHWAEGTINYAVDAGIMNGVGGSTFDPDGEATRGMVNAMMVRLAKVAGAELAEAKDQKVDTDAAHWAAATDLIALANGWTTGVRTLEDGTVVMDTDATVTREQLVTMLWRFVEHPEAEGEIEAFDDHADTSDWAKEAKAWAVGAGIINGKPGNKLDPNGTATRAEIATMFGRLMKYMTK